MNAFDQQVDVPDIARAGGEFLLHLVEVVNFDIPGRFRGGASNAPSGVRW
jgi:hypothetical protein